MSLLLLIPFQNEIFLKALKKYCNLIITLQRKSKGNYFPKYFIKQENNLKTTWDGIRNVLNVPTMVNQLLHKNKILATTMVNANSLNDFFVNNESTIEETSSVRHETFFSLIK